MQFRDFLPILIAMVTVVLGYKGMELSNRYSNSVEAVQAAAPASAGAFIGCGMGLVALGICSRREK